MPSVRLHAHRSQGHHVAVPEQAAVPVAEGETPVFTITNDGPTIRLVCDELARMPGREALESEMKARAGCTGKVRVPLWEEPGMLMTGSFICGAQISGNVATLGR